MTAAIQLGPVRLADNEPPLLLPDIDLFFNQDLTVARSMIDSLMGAGVQVVKGAVLHRAEIALDDDTLATYHAGAKGAIQERYRDLIARKVVSLEDTASLFERVTARAGAFILSVYDREGASFAQDIGAAAIKIPSSNITHQPLIAHAAGLGRPLLLDTGKSTLAEIARAVGWARQAGAADLVVEHSPLAPPAPLHEHNLRMMSTLRRVFGCPVGLSDHHHGEEMLYAAVALGAVLLEKGVYPDGAAMDQDVFHAMPVSHVAAVQECCRAVHAALGQPLRDLPDDRPKPIDRMGLVARRALLPGETLSLETVDFAFPAKGVAVEHWPLVQGWRVRAPVAVRSIIDWSDIEALAS